MLLKGFGEPRGKKTYVTVYHFDRGEFVVPTDGIAAERDFYSEITGDTSAQTLDDRITNYEGFISKALTHVRSTEIGSLVERSLVGELITHLIIRNNYARISSASIALDLFKGLGEILSSAEGTLKFFGIEKDQPSKRFSDSIAEILSERRNEIKMLGMSESQAHILILEYLKSNPDHLYQVLQPLVNALPLINEQAPEIAANAQKRGMGRELSPSQRVKRMTEFEWRVVAAERDLILPDCIAISIMKDGTTAALMLSGFDDVSHILMPVSKDRILLGTRLSHFEIPEEINQMASCCCWDFFIAPSKSHDFSELRKNIRVQMQDFSRQLVRGAIASAMEA